MVYAFFREDLVEEWLRVLVITALRSIKRDEPVCLVGEFEVQMRHISIDVNDETCGLK